MVVRQWVGVGIGVAKAGMRDSQHCKMKCEMKTYAKAKCYTKHKLPRADSATVTQQSPRLAAVSFGQVKTEVVKRDAAWIQIPLGSCGYRIY